MCRILAGDSGLVPGKLFIYELEYLFHLVD